MENRYTELFRLEPRTHQNGCPVYLEAGALLRDNAAQKVAGLGERMDFLPDTGIVVLHGYGCAVCCSDQKHIILKSKEQGRRGIAGFLHGHFFTADFEMADAHPRDPKLGAARKSPGLIRQGRLTFYDDLDSSGLKLQYRVSASRGKTHLLQTSPP